jgi:D-arginine dehydrogenase
MRVDVAVVGGGIAGVSVAAELAAAGLSVVVLEQEPQLAQHATGRSAAAFLESYGSPEIRALTRASRAYLAAAQGDAPPLLNPRRLLWIAGAGHEAKLAQLVAAEPLVRAVSEDEARRHCPALRPGWLVAAAAEDGAQDLDVAGLFDRFRRAAIRNGVVIRTSAAVDRAEPEGSGWLVRTADGADLHATTVVDAAGAWADVVAQRAGVAPIDIQPLRRTVAIATGSTMDREWPLVCEVADSFYFRPEGDALLVSLADETPSEPVDAKPSTEDVALALERVNEATLLDLRHVRTTWAGLRTFARDRNPVVGFDPSHDGFFWLAGQGGYGMQTAPALARFAAALVRREPVPDDLVAQGFDPARLAPDRFRL